MTPRVMPAAHSRRESHRWGSSIRHIGNRAGARNPLCSTTPSIRHGTRQKQQTKQTKEATLATRLFHFKHPLAVHDGVLARLLGGGRGREVVSQAGQLREGFRGIGPGLTKNPKHDNREQKMNAVDGPRKGGTQKGGTQKGGASCVLRLTGERERERGRVEVVFKVLSS